MGMITSLATTTVPKDFLVRLTTKPKVLNYIKKLILVAVLQTFPLIFLCDKTTLSLHDTYWNKVKLY